MCDTAVTADSKLKYKKVENKWITTRLAPGLPLEPPPPPPHIHFFDLVPKLSNSNSNSK